MPTDIRLVYDGDSAKSSAKVSRLATARHYCLLARADIDVCLNGGVGFLGLLQSRSRSRQIRSESYRHEFTEAGEGVVRKETKSLESLKAATEDLKNRSSWDESIEVGRPNQDKAVSMTVGR